MLLLKVPIASGIPLGFDWSLTSLRGSEVRLLPVRRNYLTQLGVLPNLQAVLIPNVNAAQASQLLAVLLGRLAGLAVSSWRSDPRRESLRKGSKSPRQMF
jgi:hypothetical protein